CSNQEDADPMAADPTLDQPVQGADPAMAGAALAETLNSVQADLQAKRYEDVTVKMATLGQMPKTPEQEREYKKTYYEVQQVLMMQAQQDPQAQAAYQQFGRVMMGR